MINSGKYIVFESGRIKVWKDYLDYEQMARAVGQTPLRAGFYWYEEGILKVGFGSKKLGLRSAPEDAALIAPLLGKEVAPTI
jgi:hypothetical protein